MVISNLEFLIADTFTDSLGKLTGDEQKAVKTTAFDLQLDPKSPGLQFHRIKKSKDKNFRYFFNPVKEYEHGPT